MKWKQILISSGRVQHGVKVGKEKWLSAFTFVINKLLSIESISSYLFKKEKKGRLVFARSVKIKSAESQKAQQLQ